MDNTCTGCPFAIRKWRFLGWRAYCKRYKMLRNERCIDHPKGKP